MNIIVKKCEPTLLELELLFTDTEIQEPLIATPLTTHLTDEKILIKSDSITPQIEKTEAISEKLEKTEIPLKTEPIPIEIEPITTTNNIILQKTPETSNYLRELGRWVDETRELYCGDVIPPETKEELIEAKPAITDSKGKIISEAIYERKQVEIPKDISKCPCFSIGNIPVKEEIDPLDSKIDELLIDESMEEVVDEPRIQKPV